MIVEALGVGINAAEVITTVAVAVALVSSGNMVAVHVCCTRGTVKCEYLWD